MIPENKGAFDPNAMPKHSGKATKNTTTDAGKFACKSLIYFFIVEFSFTKNNFQKNFSKNTMGDV
jgi:hypothetical protein